MREKRGLKHLSMILLGMVVIPILILGVLFLLNRGREEPIVTKDFKAAVLIPGPVIDGGWNSLAYEGIQKAKKEMDIEVSHVVTETPTSQEDQFRTYALEGYNVIFGHGYEFQDPAKLVALDFPDTVFITSSGGTITHNISPMVFRLEQATYLFGIIAGSLTETNKIGIIGGQSMPAINSKFQAFEAGVKEANPQAEIISGYVGDWVNIGKAKELALAQVAQGVDIIFPNAGAAELGAYEVIREKELYTFGAYLNRTAQAPKSVIVNAIVDPEVFVYMARLVRNNEFEPRSYPFNLVTHPDIIKIEWNPQMEVPDNIRDKVTKYYKMIESGEVTVPQIEF